MTHETERLILRPWEDGDAQALFKYAADPEVGPRAGWPVHTSVEDSLRVIRGVLAEPETYAMVLRETGEPVGSIGLMVGEVSDLTHGPDECEIGYWTARPYWGRGLMPEAARALLRYAFLTLGMKSCWCGYYDGNLQSRRVQEKCGFLPQRTEYDKPCRLLDERRTEHVTQLTRERWLALHGEG